MGHSGSALPDPGLGQAALPADSLAELLRHNSSDPPTVPSVGSVAPGPIVTVYVYGSVEVDAFRSTTPQMP